MRGTIDVRGAGVAAPARAVPRYVALGLDVDAPHPAADVPARRPSAARGAAVAARAPGLVPVADVRDVSPVALWQRLRHTSPRGLGDADVWDLVAIAWKSSTTPASIEEGRRLYSANCAACHGEAGNGRGVMADKLTASLDSHGAHGHAPPAKPADFTNPARMLGASSTLLEGKIIRGGMGTGMPYWGPILTDAQISSLADYLWTFQFD
jgi:mono/diheme cytochrome c family protein